VRTTRTESPGKLESKWEGSYIVKMKASPSAYRLTTLSGEDLEHSWNIDNLQNFLFKIQGPSTFVIPQTMLFRPTLFSSRGVRFLTRRSHVIYRQKALTKNSASIMVMSVEKDRIDGLRHSTYKTVTARGSLDYPRVRQIQAKAA
jgi:hypothetical protein